MLTRRNIRFIAELFKTDPRDPKMAYCRAYDHDPDDETVSFGQNIYNLMQHPEVKEEIKRWEFLIAKGTKLDIDDFNAELARVAMADARDLCGYYIGACRYCYGQGHRYQRTPAEFERDMMSHIKMQEKLMTPDPLGIRFDIQGGIGFNSTKPPNDQCPECFGHGEGYEVFHDTRYLPPGAARLFDGVKRTKDGLEIRTRSRDKMILAVGQQLGQLSAKQSESDPNQAGPTVRVIGGLPENEAPELVGPPRKGDVPI